MEKVIEELKGEIELCVTHPLYPGRYIKKDRAVESAGRSMDEQKRNRNPGRQMVPGRTAA